MFAQKILTRMSGNIVTRLIAFLVSILIARTFGAEGVGKVGYIVSVIGMFGIIANLGVSQYYSVQIATEKDTTKYFSGYLFSKLVLLIPFCIVVWAYFYFRAGPEINGAIFIIGFFYFILESIGAVVRETLIGRQRFFFLSIADIAGACLKLLLFIIL